MSGRELLRYIPPVFLLLSAFGAIYLFISFASTGIFGFETLGVLFLSVLMFFTSSVLSLPRFEEFLRERKGFGRLEYWLLVSAVFLVGLVVAYLGVGLGGVEYTRFMAQQS